MRFADPLEAIRRAARRSTCRYSTGATDVLDVGCGRGEFLELLRDGRDPARGLDLNHEMVEASRARGLDVAEGDALAYVESLPDDSLGGLFAAQVVEHLEPVYLARLLEAAAAQDFGRAARSCSRRSTRRAGSRSSRATSAISRTCGRSIPRRCSHLVRASGFHRRRDRVPVAGRRIGTGCRAAPRPAEALAPGVADLIDTFNENMAKLNARMFTFQDYAVDRPASNDAFTETKLAGSVRDRVRRLRRRARVVRCRRGIARSSPRGRSTPTSRSAAWRRNHRRGTIRGLHYPAPPFAEAKLVRAIRGRASSTSPSICGLTRRPTASGAASSSRGDAGTCVTCRTAFAHGYQTLDRRHRGAVLRVGAVLAPTTSAASGGTTRRSAITWPLGTPTVLSHRATRRYPGLPRTRPA